MKPTNDERREIAARLRELADANEGYLGMGRVNRVMRDGQAILGTSGLASVADVLRRHADLIEPEPERTCKNLSSSSLFVCSECNGQVTKWRVMPSYCPNCGAKIISGKDTDVLTNEKVVK